MNDVYVSPSDIERWAVEVELEEAIAESERQKLTTVDWSPDAVECRTNPSILIVDDNFDIVIKLEGETITYCGKEVLELISEYGTVDAVLNSMSGILKKMFKQTSEVSMDLSEMMMTGSSVDSDAEPTTIATTEAVVIHELPEPTIIEEAPPKPYTPNYVDSATLTISDKRGFDNTAIQNGTIDSDDEGGVVVSKRVGHINTHGDNEGGMLEKVVHLNNVGDYEVSGFVVQYEADGKSVKTVVVRDQYTTLTLAKRSVTEGKYLLNMGNGVFQDVSIISGIPAISFGDQEILSFKKGDWVR